MFMIHQVVGALSDPVFAGLFALAIGLMRLMLLVIKVLGRIYG